MAEGSRKYLSVCARESVFECVRERERERVCACVWRETETERERESVNHNVYQKIVQSSSGDALSHFDKQTKNFGCAQL